jgi:hypothetical protein
MYWTIVRMKVWRNRGLLSSLLSIALLLAMCPLASATTFQSQSTDYGVNEVFFGSGGNLSECSTDYCTKTAAGELAVGPSSSTNYQLHAGFNTTDTPTLDFFVNGGPISLGLLNVGAVSYGSTTFSVLDYVSSGYNVILAGSPPSTSLGSSNYTLAPMTSAAASSPGTEQFGINLVANSTPPVGAAVQQVPDSTFGFGTPSAGYNTGGQFKFHDGDTIASSTKASGESLYTLSVIANISNATAAGTYSGTIGLIAVATF